MKKTSILLLSLLLSTLSLLAQQRVHVVKAKETIYRISLQYNVTPEALILSNPGIEKGIQVGQELVIPTSTPKTSPLSLKSYTVPAGQTIYNLCQLTGWTEAELYRHNPHLKEGLRAGTEIQVPSSAEITATSLPHREMLPLPTGGNLSLRVVLTLPFQDDKGGRFVDYYEGFLLAVKNAKEKGVSIDLHVFDCSDALLDATLVEINRLSHVDYIIGGVGDASVQALAQLASAKATTYVIPFSSKDYSWQSVPKAQILQVNPPHEVLHRMVAQGFTHLYRNYHIVFVDDNSEQGMRNNLIATLKDQLARERIAYEELSTTGPLSTTEVRKLATSYPRTVLVPHSSSISAASGLLTPMALALDSLDMSNVTAFGHSEWQTYTQLTPRMERVGATFYSTFYGNPKEEGYREFQHEFMSWFGHSLGNTYPKYSVLGYDTGNYLLLYHKSGADDLSTTPIHGIQSTFLFSPDLITPHLFHNKGIIFVQWQPDKSILRR